MGLQSEEPTIHVLKRSLIKLIQTALCRFVKPSALNNGRLEDKTKSMNNVKDISPPILLKEPLLRHAQVADANLQHSSSKSDLSFFLDRFPTLRPAGCTVDAVVEQFSLFQCTNISSCITDAPQRMDEIWAKVGSQKDETDEPFLYELCLSVVMRGILTIPHSTCNS